MNKQHLPEVWAPEVLYAFREKLGLGRQAPGEWYEAIPLPVHKRIWLRLRRKRRPYRYVGPDIRATIPRISLLGEE